MSPSVQPSSDAQAIIDALETTSVKMIGAIETLRREISRQFDRHDTDLRAVVEQVYEQAKEIATALGPVGAAFRQENEHNG